MPTKPVWEQIKNEFAERGLDGVFLRVLGWGAPRSKELAEMAVGPLTWNLRVIAQVQGAAMISVQDLKISSPEEHRRLARHLSKLFPELIIQFRGESIDTWYWPRQLAGGGSTLEGIPVRASSLPDFLAQRLVALHFDDASLEDLTPVKVRDRVRGNVETSRITKRFYQEFKTTHEGLADSMSGIPPERRGAYATLLLNRLMFLWFLQKKGFLNGDPDYLKTCLKRLQELNEGRHGFYGFYRDYLLDLFFNYLNDPEHQQARPELSAIIGDVPYINGGIFGASEDEIAYQIAIPDSAFEAIFEVFGGFTWHLDTRPTGNPAEINPEVIGYIFEQYINYTAEGKRDNGAYYTKRDVTGFMANQALVPRLLQLLEAHGIEVVGKFSAEPIRYLHESSTLGLVGDSWTPVPESVLSIFNGDPAHWKNLEAINADESLLLDGESWVEMFDRRQRVDALLAATAAGNFSNLNELVSANVNLQSLLLESLSELDDPELVAQLWADFSSISVLDPTCGSGAFLFAALEVLEVAYLRLYETALSLGIDTERLVHTSGHNRQYAVRKHAALNNLFGTDLMPDAIETAKLRIFLALAACIDSVEALEPLPDLDFNLKCGNLVVGFATSHDTERLDGDLFAMRDLDALQPRLAELESELARFRAGNTSPQFSNKAHLAKLMGDAESVANEILWRASGSAGAIHAWITESRPLHWFISFPEVMRTGGFDVILGNPPYIGKRSGGQSLKRDVRGYKPENCADFYAVCYERSLQLLNSSGRHSFIVMLSMAFSEDYAALRGILAKLPTTEWWATFGHRPDGLFTGPGVKNTIVTIAPGTKARFVTQHNVFNPRTRQWLFENLSYFQAAAHDAKRVIRGGIIQDLLEALDANADTPMGAPGATLALAPTALYWLPVLPWVPPIFNPDGSVLERQSSRSVRLKLSSNEDSNLVLATCAGKLGFAWWASTADNFDVAAKDVVALRAWACTLKQPDLVSLAQKVREAGLKSLLQTLYAGKLLINIRWLDARDATDAFDSAAILSTFSDDAWRRLNIWYWKSMPPGLEQPANSVKCDPKFAEEVLAIVEA